MTSGPNSFDPIKEKNPGGLTEKIIRFSDFLNRRGFKVSPSATRDAVCSLLEIDPFIREDFFSSLRSNLAKNREEWHQFADCFHAFWDEPMGAPDPTPITGFPEAPPMDQPAACETDLQSVVGELSADTSADHSGADHETSYSPLPAVEKKITSCFDKADIPSAERAIKNILNPFRPFPSRRFKKTRKTADIDFPSVMRRSLKYDGLPLALYYKTRRKKLKRVVFLIDVSGSMDRYARMVLPLIPSLRMVGLKSEIFVFSTALVNITAIVRRLRIEQVMDTICRHVPDWSGGTRIGQSLHQFNQDQGRQLLSRRTVVVILSDGWDLGEKDLLQHEMQRLRRRANRIIWINPLAGDPDYQPLCQGMKTALPYIDYLLPADSLKNLNKTAHLMARIISR
ncbi:MAG: VWA domain-containing protein [Desulfobacterales bacterium]|nr:VWA domain-containing protein [Desulfobacterales bacterium]